MPIRHFCLLLLRLLQVPVGTAVDPELIGSDRIHDNAVNGLDQELHFKMGRIRPKDECFSNKIEIAAGFKKSRCSEKLLSSSFLNCSPPTAEARVRFPAGTCQSWELRISMEMTLVKSLNNINISAGTYLFAVLCTVYYENITEFYLIRIRNSNPELRTLTNTRRTSKVSGSTTII